MAAMRTAKGRFHLVQHVLVAAEQDLVLGVGKDFKLLLARRVRQEADPSPEGLSPDPPDSLVVEKELDFGDSRIDDQGLDLDPSA